MRNRNEGGRESQRAREPNRVREREGGASFDESERERGDRQEDRKRGRQKDATIFRVIDRNLIIANPCGISAAFAYAILSSS